ARASSIKTATSSRRLKPAWLLSGSGALPRLLEFSAVLISRVSLIPAIDISVLALSPFAAIGAVGSDIGLISMFSRKLIGVRIAPRIWRNFLRQVGSVPVAGRSRLRTQRLEPLLGGWKRSYLQLVGSEGRLKTGNLCLRCGDFAFAHILEEPRHH